MNSQFLLNNKWLYRWQGVVDQGWTHGEIAADSQTDARRALLSQGIIPIRLRNLGRLRGRNWPLVELVMITRQLATMLYAGIPLLKSLDIIVHGSLQPFWRYVLTQVMLQVSQGHALSQVVSRYPQIFSGLFCQLMMAGEITGKLDYCCQKLAIQQEKSLELRKKLSKAVSYPIFVVIIAFCVVLLMLLFVLPEFVSIYHSFDAELPYFTQSVIAVADYLAEFGGYLLIGVILLGLIYRKQRQRSLVWQRQEEEWLLRLPWLGQLFLSVYLARLLHVLMLTQTSGLPLLTGLTVAAKSADSLLIQQAVQKIANSIELGLPFYQAIQQQTIFPKLVWQLIQVGEESGMLDEMLGKLTEIYEQEVEYLTDGIMQKLEPLLMLMLAGIIGSLVIAIYLPIFQLGNVIS